MMPPTVAIGGQFRVMLVPPPTAPRGTWSDGLCSCLSDAPVALVACCVPPLLPVMLYERVALAGARNEGGGASPADAGPFP